MSMIDIFKPRDGATGGGGMSGGGSTLLPGNVGVPSNPLNNIGGAIRDTGNALTSGANNLVGGYAGDIQSIYDLLGGNTLTGQLANTRNELLGQYGITQGYEDLARNSLTADADLARRGLALDQAGLGVQRGATQRDLGAIAQLLGINESSLARQLASTANLQNLNAGSYWTQVAGVNLSEDVNRRGLRDDAVARGAFNAPGTVRGFTDIEKEAQLARQAADISYQQTGQSLDDRAGSAQEEAARTRIGLNRQAGDANDTLKRLDIEAQRLGLTADQISNTLNQGLARLGLESLTNANDLITRLNSANVEQSTMAANLLAQAATLAGLPGVADIMGSTETPAPRRVQTPGGRTTR